MSQKATPAMVKELREKSSAGMMDCVKALNACNCDIEEAMKWLRENGIAKAEKKAGNTAAEGLCNAIVNGNEILTYELNCQTDFVAQNTIFIELLEKIGAALIASSASNDEEALKVVIDGKPISEILLEATASGLGEKISLRRVQRSSKKDGESYGVYKHQGGRIVSVITVEGNGNETVARDVALHVAASNPKFISREQVNQDVLAKEREIILNEAMNENAQSAKPKPENIVEKMVEGRVNKYLQETCLVDQEFIKDPNLKVGQFVKNSNTTIVNMVRVEVGEGIEKEVVDFAAEVAAQVNAA
ncbi:MAG: translation elongation factor Ts [bacterium]